MSIVSHMQTFLLIEYDTPIVLLAVTRAPHEQGRITLQLYRVTGEVFLYIQCVKYI